MQLEMIRPSEVSQKEKDKYYMTSLKCGIQNTMSKPIHKTESWTWRIEGKAGEKGVDGEFGVSRCQTRHNDIQNG